MINNLTAADTDSLIESLKTQKEKLNDDEVTLKSLAGELLSAGSASAEYFGTIDGKACKFMRIPKTVNEIALTIIETENYISSVESELKRREDGLKEDFENWIKGKMATSVEFPGCDIPLGNNTFAAKIPLSINKETNRLES